MMTPRGKERKEGRKECNLKLYSKHLVLLSLVFRLISQFFYDETMKKKSLATLVFLVNISLTGVSGKLLRFFRWFLNRKEK